MFMLVQLKELGTITTGNTPSKQNTDFYDSDDISFIKPDLLSDSEISLISYSNEFISEKARSKARIADKDSIFVTCIGTIGKIGIASDGEYAFNQQINVIKVNDSIFPKYLAYALFHSKPRLIEIANAPVVPIINKTQFEKFTINVEMDKSKQREIITTLDKLQSIITHRTQQLEKLDELIKARFVEMFGEPILNSKEWKMATIGDIVSEVKYGTSRPAVEGGKYAYLRMNNLTYDGYLDLTDLKRIDIPDNEIEKCIVRKGDVLFNRTNSVELVGKTCVFDEDEDMVIAGYIIRVRLKPVMLPLVLSCFMNTDALKAKLRDMAKGAVNQANINAQELQSIKIYLPPLDLQHQFVAFVDQINKSKVAVQKALDEAQLLFDSLMQEYFG